MEIVKCDHHVSTVLITQESRIERKTACDHLDRTEFKKKLDFRVPHKLTPKKPYWPTWKSLLNSISEASGDWWLELCYLPQRQATTAMVETRIDGQEDFAVRSVGLTENHLCYSQLLFYNETR